jgi:hypothetical protein
MIKHIFLLVGYPTFRHIHVHRQFMDLPTLQLNHSGCGQKHTELQYW